MIGTSKKPFSTDMKMVPFVGCSRRVNVGPNVFSHWPMPATVQMVPFVGGSRLVNAGAQCVCMSVAHMGDGAEVGKLSKRRVRRSKRKLRRETFGIIFYFV